MAKKFSIPKNRSDQEMLAGFTEATETKPSEKNEKNQNNEQVDSTYALFFTPELQEQIGKELLKLKIKLYQQGIVDFDLKVKTVGNDIVLTPKAKRNKKV